MGSKRIGVAISDELGVLATPRGAIYRRSYNQDMAAILRLVEETQSEQIVVGHPLGLSGMPTEETRRVEQFATVLSTRTTVAVELWDERLTTAAARKIVGSGPEARRRGHRDAVAAALLLQSYLDRRARSSASSSSSF